MFVFSSPFLGTFFQLKIVEIDVWSDDCFRPLSWGLFFNMNMQTIYMGLIEVFVPFLGDFFSIA